MRTAPHVWIPRAARNRRGRLLDIDFQRSNGLGKYPATTTIGRDSEINAPTSSGVITNFGANALAIVDQGMITSEGRTNLIIKNRDLSVGATWITVSTTIATGQAGVDGSTNGCRVTDNDAANARRVRQEITITGGATLTASVYVKQEASTNYAGIEFTTETGGTTKIQAAMIRLSDGDLNTWGTQNGTYGSETVGGWYRVWVTLTSDALNTTGSIRLYPAIASTGGTTDPALTTGATFDFPQVEVGKYPSMPIFTDTVAAARLALDLRYDCPEGLINDYYVYIECKMLHAEAQNTQIERFMAAYTSGNVLVFDFYTRTADGVITVFFDSSTNTTTDTNYVKGDTLKLLFRRSRLLGTHLFVNGQKVGWSAKTADHSAIDYFVFGNNKDVNRPIAAIHKAFRVFRGQISDTKSTAVTSV